MEAYLDNSATTRCSKAAADMVYKLLTEDYGNPSSLHMKGVEAENYINDAKKKIAKTLRVQDKEILFTSGGTESNNTAIIGAAMANKRAGRHIITSSVEHASVLSVMQFLEEQGFEITYLPVNHDGVISVEELKNAVSGTFFVCGLTSNDFTDLTPQQMKRYEELYHDPQLFFLLGKTLCVEHTTPEEYTRVMAPPPKTKESPER